MYKFKKSDFIAIVTVIGLSTALITTGTIVNDQSKQIDRLKTKVRANNDKIKELKSSNDVLDGVIIDLKDELSKKPPTLDEQNAFYHASQVYGIDYKLLLAISQLETGYFTSDVYNNYNNVGGIKTKDGKDNYQYFNSKTESIYEMARNLKYNYIDEGLDTPRKMSYKYCPPTPESWCDKVEKLMNKIK